MAQTYKIPEDVPVRQATPTEELRMSGWVAWSYQHGMPVVYWLVDNAITMLPKEKDALTRRTAVVLRREA